MATHFSKKGLASSLHPYSRYSTKPTEGDHNSCGQKVNSNSNAQKVRYPNPPEHSIPDPVTLRDQWRFAIKQYSRWYSQAWGTAILTGVSFFALGWFIKGSNPLLSKDDDVPSSSSPDALESR